MKGLILPSNAQLAFRVRWGIEEGYKMYKARVQVEAFSGKTVTAVKQDMYAKIMRALARKNHPGCSI